ncbi:MAG: uroporphyrinogen-III C-methyltransferase [Planctomycetota bacterium]
MADRPLRIGVTGSAATGKTALVEALAAELGLPVVCEETRDYLTSRQEGANGRGFESLSKAERRTVLESLFARRVERERALESFVADNTSLDFTAYALHHGIYDDRPSSDGAPLLTRPSHHVASYDAVFVLPHGALPYVRDGVRSDRPLVELRYQHLVESVLQRSFASHRTHAVPRDCTELVDRVAFAILVLERTGLLDRGAHGTDRPVDASPGVVYLVGAGPGDPALLTVRARELLDRSDVVATDKLIPTELLETLRNDVEVLQVGHRGRGSRTGARRIHPAVIEAALDGRSVVRLKAGDPMVFGRGAEEAEELRAAGIPFEIVPGVSAAMGAASYAGIPLTHREDTSAVTFVTGHEASPEERGGSRRSGIAAEEGTVVLYMAAQRLEASLARLVAAGRAPDTPAAYVAGATHMKQRVIVGTLADLAARARDEDRSRPAIVIVGDVVARRRTTEWLEARRPLRGRSVLVARAQSSQSRIAAALRDLGARVVESPIVEDAPVDGEVSLRRALGASPVAILLGDPAATRSLLRSASRLEAAERMRMLELPAIALTERAATDAEERGLAVAALARASSVDSLREAVDQALGERRGCAIVPVEKRGRPRLVSALASVSLEAVEVPVLERGYRPARSDVGDYDAAVYSSSTSVRAVFDDPLAARLLGVPAISIGPDTSETLRTLGAHWVEEASEITVEATIALTLRALRAARVRHEAVR